jgi:polyisoprenoid-binding protein YceI
MKRSLRASLLCVLLVAPGATVAQGVLFDRSEIRFVSRQMGVNVEGRFRKWGADVVFLPADLTRSRAAIDIDIGSIDLASPEAEAEARAAVWFDAAKFPTARFASTSIRGLGADRYEVAGQLAIKGIEKPALVPVTLGKDSAGNAVLDGRFTVKRLDYRLGEGIWADTDTVADDVVVRFRIVLSPRG